MKNSREIRNKGSSTVFLCMITGLVLILIFALVSVARFRWEKVQIVRSGRVAAEAEFSKFYRPLYDAYKLFYYMEDDSRGIEAGVAGYFIKNQKNMPEILALTLEYAHVSKVMYAIDDGAVNVGKQMEECLLYSGIEKLFDDNVNNYDEGKVLDNVQKEINNIDDKAYLDKKVLQLLELVEGIKVSGGDISVAGNFVKEAVFDSPSPSHVGIDSDAVWEKVKDRYYNADVMIKKLAEITKKALEGNTVTFPKKKIEKWKQKLQATRNETENALGVVDEIVRLAKTEDKNSMICNPDIIKTTLNNNIEILDRLIEFAEYGEPSNEAQWKDYEGILDEAVTYSKRYKVKELRFDYSGLVTYKSDDPRKNAGNNVGGILEMLISDNKTVSKKGVAEKDIYMSLMKEEDKVSHEYGTDIFGDDYSKLGDFVSDCSSFFDNDDGINKAGMIAYADMFFKSYYKKEVTSLKEHALEYEREYIISGNKTDEKNLKETVNKLLLMRSGISMIELMNNEVCKKEAYVAALSIVGFSGMDALVRVVQYSILAAWAYEDACIDVAILLEGKKIPYVKKGNLNLSFAQMLEFGEKFIDAKVKENKCIKGTDYSFWINTIIFTQKKSKTLYRIMDLIQHNMKLNYSRKFSFQKAVYGAKVELGCCAPYDSYCAVTYQYE